MPKKPTVRAERITDKEVREEYGKWLDCCWSRHRNKNWGILLWFAFRGGYKAALRAERRAGRKREGK